MIYYCHSLNYLIYFYYISDYYYKTNLHDGSFFETNIITLPNTRLKRSHAEPLVHVTATQKNVQNKNTTIQSVFNKNNDTKSREWIK